MKTDGTKDAERSAEDIKEIGDKIGVFFHLVFNNLQMVLLTEADLFDFQAYLARQEAIGPILQPTFFAHEGGFDKIDECKKRVSILQEILRLKVK